MKIFDIYVIEGCSSSTILYVFIAIAVILGIIIIMASPEQSMEGVEKTGEKSTDNKGQCEHDWSLTFNQATPMGQCYPYFNCNNIRSWGRQCPNGEFKNSYFYHCLKCKKVHCLECHAKIYPK